MQHGEVERKKTVTGDSVGKRKEREEGVGRRDRER